MKGNLLKASVLGGMILITGCSTYTTLKTENTAKKQVPDWYLEHDTKTEKGLIFGEDAYFAASVAVSPDMEMAVKKATLKAKAKIADRINGEMNNRTTYVYNEQGVAETMAGSMSARDEIVNVITDTVLRTYGIREREIVYNEELNNYRAFILVNISQADIETLVTKFEQDKRIKELVKLRGQDTVDSAIESFNPQVKVGVVPNINE